MIARFATCAMATRFELVLEGGDEVRLRAIAEEAFEEIRECERRWSAFESASVVALVNRVGARGEVKLDSETFELLQEALEVWRASEGWFDPALGRVMERWGFRDGAVACAPVTVDVDGYAYGERPLRPPFALDASSHSLHSLRPNSQLDLGAIAKGRALDLAVEVLRDHGVPRALFHGGTSSVVAIGAPAGTPGWSVALDDASEAPRALLRDAALAVSSNSGRRVSAGGHILDPHSATPTRGDSTVAVVAPLASTADAWATALCARAATETGQRELPLPDELSVLSARRSSSTPAPLEWRSATDRTDPFLLSAESRAATS